KDQGGRDIDLQTPMRYTGQRLDEAIGLYYYNARYYDPALGRFAQADTIVPEPGNPQSLNRYTYVGNQPTIYNDPSGNCPWCIAAIGGAIVGTTIEWGRQAISNKRSHPEMSYWDAATDVDVGKIAGAAVTGAIVGGTFGAIGAAGGIASIGIKTSIAAGVSSTVVAGQTSALVGVAVNEGINYLSNEGHARSATFLQKAHNAGFLDPNRILIDAASGAMAGGAAYYAAAGLTKAARQMGYIDDLVNAEPVWEIQLLPETAMTGNANMIGYAFDGGRGQLVLTAGVAEGYIAILIKSGPDKAARWLFNRINDTVMEKAND
ncbi:MAG: RHS repeat-associated core domain-containing protein, partial [Gammaproteobacteria bacterium]|nr:RHS repeat-associated core domain-containing protein [Gammaproteobacteria bacterium]